MAYRAPSFFTTRSAKITEPITEKRPPHLAVAHALSTLTTSSLSSSRLIRLVCSRSRTLNSQEFSDLPGPGRCKRPDTARSRRSKIFPIAVARIIRPYYYYIDRPYGPVNRSWASFENTLRIASQTNNHGIAE